MILTAVSLATGLESDEPKRFVPFMIVNGVLPKALEVRNGMILRS